MGRGRRGHDVLLRIVVRHLRVLAVLAVLLRVLVLLVWRILVLLRWRRRLRLQLTFPEGRARSVEQGARRGQLPSGVYLFGPALRRTGGMLLNT
ncbi:hypothetical protein ABZZ17_33450 [Streptomyces sp. NPDC006512]|uniref:hypothetical protein n=1 Tax=Streptomyces sp. NPDC006512 TaxID=3154307 RepID=UPI0033AB6B8F